MPFRQDTAFLAMGERTNANGSKAFRDAMLAGRYDECVEIARAQTRDGAHVLDVNVDYVGRDGAADMREVVSRLSTAVTLPLMLDSTEPPVIQAGLELLGGRSVVNSVNYEDGDGPDSRIARMMPLVREHGAAVVALTIDEQGQARTAEWKLAVATRLIEDLTGNWGMDVGDIIVDCLTFPVSTGQEETRRDALETINAIRELKRRYPDVQTTLGVSNVSFGLNPAARAVLNSVFLAEAVDAGLDSAIVHASRIMPIARIPDEQREAALDLVWDRRRPGYDPLSRLLELFEGATAASLRESRAQELARLPLWERLARRIIDGERNGLEADLDAGLAQRPALEIVNDVLLDGMKTVGDLFGSGQMQLPFVLQSAEVMKAAVNYLEPHMERSGDEGKGRIVLATVKGDVHDIGKNLVDIILSNNGYDVVNIGIKQPISAILEAATEHGADVIGMSGLLVKSTVVMRDNLAELNSRKQAGRWPVLLGGAALTRAYVEQDLAAMFDGEVRYARDAFEGLRLMDAFMAVKRGQAGAQLPALRPRRVSAATRPGPDGDGQAQDDQLRSDVSATVPVPEPPFWGTRVVKGIPLADYAAYLDERALFLGQWGLKPTRGGSGPSHQELAETEGRPRLRMWLERAQTEGLLQAAVVHGYFPCVQRGQRPRRAGRERPASASGSASRGSAATGGCAWPTSSGPGTPGRPTWWPSSWSRSARGSARRPPSCSPRTPTATTWSCTACPCSWPRRWRSTGTRGCATRSASAAPTRPTWTHPEGRLPGLPVLLRLPGLPGPGGPGRGDAAAAAGPDRGRAVRGVPAGPGAVHRRDDRASPGSQVLQHLTRGAAASARPLPGKVHRMSRAAAVSPPAVHRSPLQAVLFDMDGLLVDSEPLWFEVESAVMARLGGEWTAEDQYALVGGSLEASLDYLLARAAEPAPREQVARWMVDGMTDLLRERGVHVLPGARELLAEVTAARVPSALVTSSERQIMDAVIASIGVAFGATVCAEDVRAAQAGPRAVPAGRGAARRRPGQLHRARGLAERGGRRGGGGLPGGGGAQRAADPHPAGPRRGLLAGPARPGHAPRNDGRPLAAAVWAAPRVCDDEGDGRYCRWRSLSASP